jgi:hypothetical protein
MASHTSGQSIIAVTPRILDLRSEFEAQLRAIARLEEQLARSRNGAGAASVELSDVLRRELAEMLHNNQNIRDLLLELATVTGVASAIG